MHFVCLFLAFLPEASAFLFLFFLRQEFHPVLTKEGFFDLASFLCYRFIEVVEIEQGVGMEMAGG